MIVWTVFENSEEGIHILAGRPGEETDLIAEWIIDGETAQRICDWHNRMSP